MATERGHVSPADLARLNGTTVGNNFGLPPQQVASTVGGLVTEVDRQNPNRPHSKGLRVRLTALPGQTPRGLLNRPLVMPAVMRGFSFTESASHTEYDTIRDGQFSQAAAGPETARQLRSIDDMEVLVLEAHTPWLISNDFSADHVHTVLFKILHSRKPVTLLAQRQLGMQGRLLRANVTFRQISTEMRQGEPDTVYYVCSIGEWRHAKGRRIGEGRGSTLPTTHKLTDEDSLHSLSMHFYHSAGGADYIAKANGITKFGKKTPLVKYKRYKVGSKIKIPKLPAVKLAPDVGATVGTFGRRHSRKSS